MFSMHAYSLFRFVIVLVLSYGIEVNLALVYIAALPVLCRYVWLYTCFAFYCISIQHCPA